MIGVVVYICILINFVQAQSDEVCFSVRRSHVGDDRPISARAGKRGPRGFTGLPGHCACNETEISEMKRQIQMLSDKVSELDHVKHGHSDKLIHCGVGIYDGRVVDSQITASSYWDHVVEHSPRHARLNNREESGVHIGAWASGQHRRGEWIQVDLQERMVVTGIITQGRPSTRHPQWVTSFKVATGDTTDNLQIIQNQNGQDKIFQGNQDTTSHVTNLFPTPVYARFIRVIAESFHVAIVLRMELLTC